MPKMIKDKDGVYYFEETEEEKESKLLKEKNKLLEDVIIELQEKLKQIDKGWKPKNDLAQT